MPRFRVKQDMTSTMQQMLDALMARAGNGEGEGGDGGVGGGPGGGGQDGYSVAGNSAAIPAYGPNRLNFSQSQLTASRGKATNQGGTGPTGKVDPTTAEAPETETFRENENQTIVPDNIPAKYREAVKRYFSQPEKSPAP